MKVAIDILESERKETVECLKLQNGDKNCLSRIKELDKAINWIKKLNELGVNNVQKYDIIELPDPKTGFSEYRVMNDCETDNMEYWQELEINNKRISMTMGDIIIITRPN